MNNGIIYIRVSSKEQTRVELPNQERECKAFARKGEQGIIVPEANIFRDEGEFAKFLDRPALQRMLKFVQDNKGKIDFFISG